MATIITQIDGAGALNGTADDDFIIAQHLTGTGVPDPQVLNGGDGDDVIFGDHTALFADDGSITNDSFGTALDINDSQRWGLRENPDVLNATLVPYATVVAIGNGALDVYSVFVGAGETLTVDLDYGSTDHSGAESLSIDLFDGAEDGVGFSDAENDDLGGFGSQEASGQDPFLTLTNTTGSGQTYYIQISDTGSLTEVPVGVSYMLNVSVTGHAATSTAVFGNDVIDGGAGDDVLYGAEGDDILNGGDGNDLIVGGSGADVIDGGAGEDDLYGGAGIDTLSYASAIAGVFVNLDIGFGEEGPAADDIFAGFENLTGSAFADGLVGDSGDNVLRGGDGDDTLDGFDGGADALYGGDGDDTLYLHDVGAIGAGDVFDGGAGSDRLVTYSFKPGVYNLRNSTVTGVETLVLASNGTPMSIQLTASQISSGVLFIEKGVIPFDANTEIFVGAGEALDVSALVFTNGYGVPPGDRVTIFGDVGNETIIGTSIRDDIFGGDGDDVIDGGVGMNVLDGGAGIDTLSYASSAASVDVSLRSTSGSSGQAASDTFADFENLTGSAFDDDLEGDSGDNVLRGEAGNDILSGFNGGVDALYGEDGDDVLELYSASAAGPGDVFDGGAGFDTLETRYFDPGVYDLRDSVVTGIERLLIKGGGAFGAPPTTVQLTADQIASGIVLIEKDAFDPFVAITEVFMDTAVTLDLSGIGFILYQTSGSRVIIRGDGDSETIIGTSVEDDIFGSDGDDIINGGDGWDLIDGGVGNDVIDSGAGNDIVLGGSGADTMDGGAGFDTLDYSASTTGVGLDLVNGNGDFAGGPLSKSTGDSFTGFDKFVGTNHFDIFLGGAGAHEIDGGGALDLVIYFDDDASLSANLETGTVYGGTRANGDRLTNIEELVGTNGFGDSIIGSAADNLLDGAGGNDVLEGLAGADLLIGGAGNDYARYQKSDAAVQIDLGAGTATGGHATGDTLNSIENLWGSAFGDTLTGDAGDNTILGRAGDDTLDGGVGNDLLSGGDGSDILMASLGVDGFYGNSGIDTYQIAGSSDDGSDTDMDLQLGVDTFGNSFISIENVHGGLGNEIIRGDAADNVIMGGAGNDVIEGRAGADTLDGGDGIDTLSYASSAEGVFVSLDTSFGSSGDAEADTFGNFENVTGSAFSDYLIGDSGDNVLRGGAGNDFFVSVGGGADEFYGEDGTDFIILVSPADAGVGDVFDGGAGFDRIQTGSVGGVYNLRNSVVSGIERIDINGGNSGWSLTTVQVTADQITSGLTSINKSVLDPFEAITEVFMGAATSLDLSALALIGEYGDTPGDGVIIIGDADNETIIGTSISDDISGGDGDDVIEGGAGEDYLDGGAGIDTLSYASSNQGVSIDLRYGIVSGGHATNDIISGFENIVGSAFGDTLTGNNLDNVLRGGAGNDAFSGQGGADELYGEDGDDMFFLESTETTGAADVFDGGAGLDEIHANSFSPGVYDLRGSVLSEIEKLVITGGYFDDAAPVTVQLTAEQTGSELYLLEKYAHSTFTAITEVFMGAATTLDLSAWVFAEGSLFSVERYGDAAEDRVTIRGDGDGETIIGTSIRDDIFGGGGDDLLIGGGGDDLLDGGDGVDTVSYADAGARVAVFLNRDPADLGGGEGIDTFVSIENIIGSDFDDRINGDGSDNVLMGGLGDDVLVGLAGNDTLDGGDGNDELTGSGGDDTLLGGDGDDQLFGLGGADTFEGGAGNDLIEGGLGVDIIFGGDGDDDIFGLFGFEFIDGGDGNDNIRADGSGDTAYGGAGNDRIVGGNGKDILWGGAGNDVLFGGGGLANGDGLRDVFVFKSAANGGGGFDIIRDFEDAMDKIDLTESGYTNFADVFADAAQVGANVEINFDFSGLLRINSFNLADLTAGDFLF